MSKRIYLTDASIKQHVAYGFVCISGKIKIKDGAIFHADKNCSIDYAEGFAIEEAIKAIARNDKDHEDTNIIVTDSNEAYFQILNLEHYNATGDYYFEPDEVYVPIANRLTTVSIRHSVQFIVIKSHATVFEQKVWFEKYGYKYTDSFIKLVNFGNTVIDFIVRNAASFDEVDSPKDFETGLFKFDKSKYSADEFNKLVRQLNATRNFYINKR